ncbi:aminotransferase class I/II-fold pyridoxal phosphate-dependent enzyme, partial [Bacillus sp. SIMBA_161]
VTELPEHPNWAILRTFSKALRLAAHRVGYCIAHPQVTQTLEKIRLPYNLPSFSQAAALVALKNREQLLSKITETQQERDKLYHFLTTDSRLQVWESDANFIYFRLNLPSREEQNKQQQHLV